MAIPKIPGSPPPPPPPVIETPPVAVAEPPSGASVTPAVTPTGGSPDIVISDPGPARSASLEEMMAQYQKNPVCRPEAPPQVTPAQPTVSEESGPPKIEPVRGKGVQTKTKDPTRQPPQPPEQASKPQPPAVQLRVGGASPKPAVPGSQDIVTITPRPPRPPTPPNPAAVPTVIIPAHETPTQYNATVVTPTAKKPPSVSVKGAAATGGVISVATDVARLAMGEEVPKAEVVKNAVSNSAKAVAVSKLTEAAGKTRLGPKAGAVGVVIDTAFSAVNNVSAAANGEISPSRAAANVTVDVGISAASLAAGSAASTLLLTTSVGSAVPIIGTGAGVLIGIGLVCLSRTEAGQEALKTANDWLNDGFQAMGLSGQPG